MALVRVKGKYQVTIPKEVWRKLGLRVGITSRWRSRAPPSSLNPRPSWIRKRPSRSSRRSWKNSGKSGRLFRKKRWSRRFWRRSGRCGAKGRDVLVAAFLHPAGVNGRVLALAGERYELCLSKAILAEVQKILSYPRLRRYGYSEEEVEEFLRALWEAAFLVRRWPRI